MNREEIAKKIDDIIGTNQGYEARMYALSDWHIAKISVAEKQAKQEGYDQAMKDYAGKVEEAEKRGYERAMKVAEIQELEVWENKIKQARREVAEEIKGCLGSCDHCSYSGTNKCTLNEIITANSDTERSK